MSEPSLCVKVSWVICFFISPSEKAGNSAKKVVNFPNPLLDESLVLQR